ncbi:hypothetical protein CDO52_02725 [Nocardiopsis gilva YIM 90087]|uniref:EfeO-type cupredoxin-like domain-containing protein n=1 Tax=Nocardiopsis gilva YIM 90087 TaxID=1235441 RepID=A0A223S139_9ACTN|nr:hypothetical protein [Nocardiopsis gilva]ASU81845.1 hypothetical protein CDO52_02725 [Nocardiopsis gilva YIM 90087]
MHIRVWTALAGAVLVLAATGCANEAAKTEADASDPAPSSSASEHHGHKMREVAGDDAPSVELEATEDPASGWNVHLTVEGYDFTPDRTGEEPKEGEGHAHLYVDGEKVARVYGPWHHLPASAVPEGEHTLTVRLSANDHSTWAVDGEPISDSVTVAGEQAADTDGGDADVTVEISLRDGSVSPEPGRVEVGTGEKVRITVESDSSDTVHLHGYDIEKPVGPDAPATLVFTADKSGVFELETHESGTLLTQIAVQ